MRSRFTMVLTAIALLAGAAFIYQTSDDASNNKASIGSGQSAPPNDKAADAQKIMDDKAEKAGNPDPGKPGKIEKADNDPRNDVRIGQTCDASMPPNVEIMWRAQPRNLNEAKGMSTRIMVGTVQEITQLPPVVHQHPGEPGGTLETPVQQITFKVDDNIKGPARKGETQAIVRAGDGEGCYRVEGDPAYARGEQYLLLLEESGPGKPPHVISPAGRFKVNGPEQALQAFERNQTAAEVAGQKLSAVVARLKG